MATTYGTMQLSNGQVVGVQQTANAAVNTRLPVDIAKPADANTNTYDFMVRSPCCITDWDSGAIASGAVEFYSDDIPTGIQCTLVKCGIALTTRIFPRVCFKPGKRYSLRVTTVLPA
jgi:hypothetical protein